ncbi:alpha/beta fold hydrolase [Phormidesmis priestleyi]
MLQTTHSLATLPVQPSSKRLLIETRDGISLFHYDWGTGQPVVFVHGWGLGAGMWEYQMTDLSNRGLRCIAYDKRGCGRSDQPGHGYDFDTLADDLASLIEQLDLRNVTLVGFSAGCGDVARYLSRHGMGRIARSVLIGSVTPFLAKTADNPEGIDPSVFDEMIAALRRDRPRYLAASAPSFFGAGLPTVSVSPELIQWGVGLALQASPKATIEMVRAFSETDFRSDMPAFTMPTLTIHGDQDQNHPIDLTGQKTAQAIPGNQFKVYEGAAHGLFVTHKEQLNRDLLTFIQC